MLTGVKGRGVKGVGVSPYSHCPSSPKYYNKHSNSLLFYAHRHEVSHAMQSMALLTLLYDKPFQVVIKHCLRSAMLELVSDTHDFATHMLYIRYSTGLRSELTGGHKAWTIKLRNFTVQ